MIKVWQHDFNGVGICRKCHTHKDEIINSICPVIGKEEVANFKDGDDW